MHKITWLAMAIIILGSSYSHAAEPKQTIVLELFTSQSCSSCPAADSLLKKISDNNPDILALSFHVDYWNHLSWKDTYSSPAYTERQRNYAQALRESGIFTPQLIINGTRSMVGSNNGDIHDAIESARKTPSPVNVILSTDNTNQLTATLTANNALSSQSFDILEVEFDRYAKTAIAAGENGGRTLESINNVTSIKNLGEFQTNNRTKTIKLGKPSSENAAILVQAKNNGPIVGAASNIH